MLSLEMANMLVGLTSIVMGGHLRHRQQYGYLVMVAKWKVYDKKVLLMLFPKYENIKNQIQVKERAKLPFLWTYCIVLIRFQ